MFSGVTSSARNPSQTKMMTLRAAGPPCCGAAGPPASPSTTNDKAIRIMNLLIFMVVLVSEFAGERSIRRRDAGLRVQISLDRLDEVRSEPLVVRFGSSTLREAEYGQELGAPHMMGEELGERDGLGGLDVDHQLKLGRLFDGELSRRGAFEDLVHVGGGAPEQIILVRSVRHEATHLDKSLGKVHHRQEGP